MAIALAAGPVQAGSGVSAPDTLDSKAPVITFQHPDVGGIFQAATQETLRFTVAEPSWGPPPGQITLSFHIDGSPLTQVNLDAEPDGSYAHVWDVPDPPANGEVEGRVRVLARDRFGWLGLRYSSWFTIVDAVSPVPDIRLVDRLGSAHPNPFNPRTTLAYSLAAAADIRLAVYDVAGRRIATLDQGPRPVGEHTAVWLGRTEDGSSAPSGVYFARLEIHGDHGTRILTTRLALVK